MSNHLARPSQDSSQRRLRRLNFRPLFDASAREDQAMLKMPASTPDQMRRRGQFLVAPKLPFEEEEQERSPEQQEPQEKPLGGSGQFVRIPSRKTPPLAISRQLRGGATYRVPTIKQGRG